MDCCACGGVCESDGGGMIGGPQPKEQGMTMLIPWMHGEYNAYKILLRDYELFDDYGAQIFKRESCEDSSIQFRLSDEMSIGGVHLNDGWPLVLHKGDNGIMYYPSATTWKH